MTTTRPRALVSLVPIFVVGVLSVACGQGAYRSGLNAPATERARTLSIRFDNGARDYVRVYLIGARRQWSLGRVEAGATATLEIPEDILAEGGRFVQLAVLAGERMTLDAAHHPQVATSLLQPTLTMASQRWTFTEGQLVGR